MYDSLFVSDIGYFFFIKAYIFLPNHCSKGSCAWMFNLYFCHVLKQVFLSSHFLHFVTFVNVSVESLSLLFHSIKT